MPAVEDLWSYGETGYHSLAAAVVRERYKREAMASAFRILGEGQLSLTKFLLVTDRPVDLKDFRATLEHVLARTNPETDLYVFSNLSMDTLDYSGPDGERGVEGRVARARRPGARAAARVPPRARSPPRSPTCASSAAGCLVVGGPPRGRRSRRRRPLRRGTRPSRGWPLVVLTDEPRTRRASPMNFLWTTFTRFEPAADIHAARDARRPPPRAPTSRPIVIDARMKPWYPEGGLCDPDTAATVTRRWREYFPDGGVEMGDSERAHLDRA